MALFQRLDAVVGVTRQRAGLDQPGFQRVVKDIGGNHDAQRPFGCVGERVVQDPKLGSQLALGALQVGSPKGRIPEASTHRQERVVVNPH